MKIVFESSDVVVVHKPFGWLSVPSIQGKSDSRPVVGLELRKNYGPVYPVHRLDFEVEGLLMFALNPKAQAWLHKIWEHQSVRKVYQAITGPQNSSHWPSHVEGLIQDDISVDSCGKWTSRIVQGKRRSFIGAHGHESLTDFKLIEKSNDTCRWVLSPLTGRRHQLRLELSRRGFPIWGDQLYGSQVFLKPHQIALAATELHFTETFKLHLPKVIQIEWDMNRPASY